MRELNPPKVNDYYCTLNKSQETLYFLTTPNMHSRNMYTVLKDYCNRDMSNKPCRITIWLNINVRWNTWCLNTHGYGHCYDFICITECMVKKKWTTTCTCHRRKLAINCSEGRVTCIHYFTNKQPVSLKYIILISLVFTVLVFYPIWMIPKVILEAFMTKTSKKYIKREEENMGKDCSGTAAISHHFLIQKSVNGIRHLLFNTLKVHLIYTIRGDKRNYNLKIWGGLLM